jgi:hypothetical protein
MKSGLAVMALGAMLAGCGGGGPGAAGNGVAAAATGDPMEAKIDALNEGQRKTAFYRAIYDADFQCDEITKIVDRPRDNGHRAWIATCGDTGDYYITLQPGGVFTVSGTPQTKTRLPKGTKMLPAGTK